MDQLGSVHWLSQIWINWVVYIGWV